jgi:rhodanese-related sulfurtransferase
MMQTRITVVLLTSAAAFAGCTAEEISSDLNSKSPTASIPTATSKPPEDEPSMLQVEAIRNIDVASAAQVIAEDDSVVILDIRTPGEFAKGHIKGAVNIDYMANDFAAKLSALDKDRKYLMHCQSGGRSGKSLPKFKELGFKTVFHLDAGFAGWQKAGWPVDK